MTYLEKGKQMRPQKADDLTRNYCPEDLHLEKHSPCGDMDGNCTKCWNREIPDEPQEQPTDTPTQPQILDSGNRREFETGAVRDMQEGKGRCDLLPLEEVAWVLGVSEADCIIEKIYQFTQMNCITCLYEVLELFRNMLGIATETMILELAKHMENGAKKYPPNNWKKGIPIRAYIDSAVRHYLKFLRGDKDEPHDRAFVWNIVCAIWTCEHMPELNEYAREAQTDAAEQAYEQK